MTDRTIDMEKTAASVICSPTLLLPTGRGALIAGDLEVPILPQRGSVD